MEACATHRVTSSIYEVDESRIIMKNLNRDVLLRGSQVTSDSANQDDAVAAVAFKHLSPRSPRKSAMLRSFPFQPKGCALKQSNFNISIDP